MPATLADRYAAAFPLSRERFAAARGLFPNGVTHDIRTMAPFPVVVERATGAAKWTVDGAELVDYFTGHGSLLLGHSPPDVVAAVREQVAKGTHYGASHDLEVRWAEWVRTLIPSAEKVRFTGSGTEATLMALRLARVHTGKPRFLRFLGHFHGWHDAVTPGSDPPYDAPVVVGVPDAVAGLAVAVRPNDLNLVESTLHKNPDIGAVILEPTGGHWGGVPIRGDFLRGLREITTRLGRLLIFDEVITGFRVAPGGAQAYYNVTPDLTSLAKILAGGLPGGCLAGAAEILDHIEHRPGKPRVRHPGTYNGNPLSAAAGVATLARVATGEPGDAANRAGRELRNRLNAMFENRGWPWV
ncbi:MAG: aspartate aminotransferase family protein, partial [Fimbriiglobus sp.]